MSSLHESGDTADTNADDHFPKPAPWVTSWPWHKWSRWQRTAVLSQIVVGLAAVLSAVVLLLSLGPQAYSTLLWRNVEYKRLAALHAGFSLDRMKEELGQPSIVSRAGRSKYTEMIFLRREHLVKVLVDGQGRVALYSVLSCDPDFRPTFTTEGSTRVQLQVRPLSKVEIPLSKLENAEDVVTLTNEDRTISYGPKESPGEPDTLVEGHTPPDRHREYFVGVNGLCADLPSVAGGAEYLGELRLAPAELKIARKTIAANFYGEVFDIKGELSDFGTYAIYKDTSGGLPTLDDILARISISPEGFELPLEWFNHQGTNTF